MFQKERECKITGPFRLLLLALCFALLFTLYGCASTNTKISATSSTDSSSTTRVVTDMAGRKVTIPKNVTRVVSLSNNTSVDTYILAPDKLLGWSFTPKTDAKP